MFKGKKLKTLYDISHNGATVGTKVSFWSDADGYEKSYSSSQSSSSQPNEESCSSSSSPTRIFGEIVALEIKNDTRDVQCDILIMPAIPQNDFISCSYAPTYENWDKVFIHKYYGNIPIPNGKKINLYDLHVSEMKLGTKVYHERYQVYGEVIYIACYSDISDRTNWEARVELDFRPTKRELRLGDMERSIKTDWEEITIIESPSLIQPIIGRSYKR
jgi:hypothetical protein